MCLTAHLSRNQQTNIQQDKFEAYVVGFFFFSDVFINNTFSCLPREVSVLMLEKTNSRIYFTGRIHIIS